MLIQSTMLESWFQQFISILQQSQPPPAAQIIPDLIFLIVLSELFFSQPFFFPLTLSVLNYLLIYLYVALYSMLFDYALQCRRE